VCYSAQYVVMCTVDVCSVLECTVYGDVYSGCVCVECYSAQYIMMCTVEVCSVL